MNIELVDKNQESSEVEAFIFEIKALPQSEEIKDLFASKVEQIFLDSYGTNDNFAIECNIQRANSALQSLTIELRIKGEGVDEIKAAAILNQALKAVI